MGGDVALESTLGSGSRFILRLPLRYVLPRRNSDTSGVRRPGSLTSSLSSRRVQPKGSRANSVASVELDIDTPNPSAPRSDVPRIVGFTAPYVAHESKDETWKAKMVEMKRAETQAAETGRKVRVLVAEDNQVNQEVVLRMLKLEKIYGPLSHQWNKVKLTDSDVTIAKDGREAFEKVRASMENGQIYNLIFMDVQMPHLDGIQSTKLIREMGYSAPIVALTAFAEKSNEDECMASGMNYFLSKPIRRPALKHVLKKYCEVIPEEENEAKSKRGSVDVSE